MSNFKEKNLIESTFLYFWACILGFLALAFFLLKTKLTSSTVDKNQTSKPSILDEVASTMPLLTGVRYPNIPLLRGKTPLGKLADFDKISNESGSWEVILEAGELAKKHPSGMCYFWAGRSGMLLITKPNHIKQFMWQNFDRGSFTGAGSGLGEMIGHNNQFLLSFKDEEWGKKNKRIKDRIFSDKPLNTLLPGMLNIADESLKTVQSEKTINLKDFSTRLALDNINKLVLGIHSSIDEHYHEIVSTLDNLDKVLANPLNHIMFKFSSQLQYFGYKSQFTLQKEAMREVFNKRLIKPNIKTLVVEDNMIHDIIDSYGVKDQPVTEIDEIYNDGCMMLSGYGATTTLLQTVLMLLAKFPEVLRKLREEMDQCKLPSKNSEWTKQQLDDLKYLDCIIKETLRLYPPATHFTRIAETSFTFIDQEVRSNSEYKQLLKDKNRDTSNDIVLNVGDTVFISPYHTQRLENLFKDADKFIPERFYNTDKNNSFGYSFFPFGLGIRDCPGRYFVMQQIKAEVVKIFTKYNIEHDQEFPFKYHAKSTLQFDAIVNAKFTLKPIIKEKEGQKIPDNSFIQQESVDVEVKIRDGNNKPQDRPRQIPQ